MTATHPLSFYLYVEPETTKCSESQIFLKSLVLLKRLSGTWTDNATPNCLVTACAQSVRPPGGSLRRGCAGDNRHMDRDCDVEHPRRPLRNGGTVQVERNPLGYRV
ncbi:unnamed protein product [Discosporangium mesarthrocarpum]